MKILIDENLPKRLRQALVGHEAYTVPQMGWATKKNGELLKLMSGQFDVFLTMDSNLQFQQNIASYPIRFIRLVAPSNKLSTVLPLMPYVLGALDTLQPGELIEISLPAEPEEDAS